MLYVIFGIFIFLFIFNKVNSIFSSDYRLTMIMGQKGSGKTSLMIKYMLQYNKKGWSIYTDLIGVNIPGVRIINIKDLTKFTPPHRSAVFLDEVGLSLDNRDYKNFGSGLRDWFALQRHYKCRVFQNSQVFDCDKKVRDRTDEFLFVQKIMGPVSLIRPIVKRVTPNDMSNPDCDTPVSQVYKWGSLFSWKLLWLPKYAKYFDSFVTPPRDEIPYQEVQETEKAEDLRISDRLYAKLIMLKLNARKRR